MHGRCIKFTHQPRLSVTRPRSGADGWTSRCGVANLRSIAAKALSGEIRLDRTPKEQTLPGKLSGP